MTSLTNNLESLKPTLESKHLFSFRCHLLDWFVGASNLVEKTVTKTVHQNDIIWLYLNENNFFVGKNEDVFYSAKLVFTEENTVFCRVLKIQREQGASGSNRVVGTWI